MLDCSNGGFSCDEKETPQELRGGGHLFSAFPLLRRGLGEAGRAGSDLDFDSDGFAEVLGFETLPTQSQFHDFRQCLVKHRQSPASFHSISRFARLTAQPSFPPHLSISKFICQ